MCILQLILQVGAYLDLMKMFPSSFKLPMVMLAMTRVIIFRFSATYFIQLLFYYFGGVAFEGVEPQGVFWSLSLAPHHVTFVYIPY
jgi:hypothetical protein